MALRVLIVLLILAIPVELPGCGPFLPEALFHLAVGPENPVDFAQGKLGVLLPTYQRLYQVIAYRYLSGVGLSPAEAAALELKKVEVTAEPAPVTVPPAEKNPWLVARAKVPGVKPVDSIDAYRQVQKQGFFDSYLNCNDDAFQTAAATLDRVRSKPFAADWVAAQDQVFGDCSKGSDIPAASADPQLRADRAYQIASAKFYAEQYDAAHQDFQAIAADASSPWHEIAPYVAARCSIRAGKFAEAEAELQRVAVDPSRPRWHAPANSLLGYVEVRLRPAQRMHELALTLVKPNSQATIEQNLTDYRMLFDQNVKPGEPDDLTDWVVSYQAGGRGALEKWRANHALPWLVAALQGCNRKDDAVPELLAAAAAVKPDSPAYVTVNYYRARLMPDNEARDLTDKLLGGDLPVSARNEIRAERMNLSRTFEDFLRYAPRTPVDGDSKGVDVLDGDSALILDRAVPLSLLRQASTSPQLPEDARKQLQSVVAVRALVLDPAPNFDAVFRLLNTPGGGPFVRSGYGRYTDEANKIDNFRDNWWCAGSTVQPDWAPPGKKQPDSVAGFLSPEEQKQAADERQKLDALPAAPDWLSAQTMAFAQAHPDDPRIAEALYLVVRASRYGCSDDKTGDFSQRAFDLLHRRFPNSEWAKKTPYWYK